MAALMDSYQPEGINFSQHYGPSGFDGVEELDEGDIVKSKPRGKLNSYLPLVNEVPQQEDVREKPRSRDDGEISVQSGGRGISGANKRQQSKTGPIPLNGQIPAIESAIIPHHQPSPSITAGASLSSSKQRSGQSMGEVENADDHPHSETESDRGMDDSTTALLRRYTLERNGRPTSIHLGPTGEIVGSGWLSEILVTGHKKCSVTLEEDCISWRFLSRKDGRWFGGGANSQFKGFVFDVRRVCCVNYNFKCIPIKWYCV